MSGKKIKLARKQINNLIKERMENQREQRPQFSLQQLETYINLSLFLTGKKPEKIELVEQYYAWYVQEVQRQADAMGLNLGFKDDKPMFLGVPIEKKITIVTAENVPNNVAN